MNALDYIQEEHQRLTQAVESIRNASDTTKRHSLYLEFCRQIRNHLHQQQAVFYVALSDYAEFQSLLSQSFSSLERILDLVSEIEKRWDLPESIHRFALLSWSLEQHFLREEHEIFPRVNQVIQKPRLERLGTLLAARANTDANAGMLSRAAQAPIAVRSPFKLEKTQKFDSKNGISQIK